MQETLTNLRHETVPVMDRLRAHTAEFHARTEAAVDLPSQLISRARYAALLERMLGIYAPAEEILLRFEWESFGLDFNRRLKTSLLEQDLAFLQRKRQNDAAYRYAQFSLPATIAGAAGCIYVLEGATLGGQIVSRQLKNSLDISPETGGAFYASYGEDVGSMWKAFRSWANNFCSDNEERAQQMLCGAVEMFQIFEVWMSQDTRVSQAISDNGQE